MILIHKLIQNLHISHIQQTIWYVKQLRVAEVLLTHQVKGLFT